jgi:hypothetical protein
MNLVIVADGRWSDTEMTRVDECVVTVVLSDNSTAVICRISWYVLWLLVYSIQPDYAS